MILLFALIINVHADMYFPASMLDGTPKPGAHNFVEKAACEKHYNKTCVKLPKDFEPEYHVAAGSTIVIDATKKAAFDAREKAKDDEAKARKADVARIKGILESGGELSSDDLKKALKYLIK